LPDDRGSERDVVRTLWEVEKKLSDAIEDAAEKQIRETRKAAADQLAAIQASTAAIVAAIQGIAPPSEATKLVLQYILQGGTIMGAPVTGTAGQVYDPSIVESNPTTPSIQPIGPLAFASDNVAAVTVDAVSGIATLVAAGTANVSVIDQGNGLTDTVAFTVTAAPPPVATALALAYTLAVAQRRHLR
jgi:hypothetical protein